MSDEITIDDIIKMKEAMDAQAVPGPSGRMMMLGVDLADPGNPDFTQTQVVEFKWNDLTCRWEYTDESGRFMYMLPEMMETPDEQS